MEADGIKLTREELYERVWSMPATKLSKEFGISDVALGKLCKKLNIPKPYPGYWQQLAAGHCVQKEKLPPIKRGVPAVTYIHPHQPVTPFKPKNPVILAQVETENQAANRITVRDKLHNPHPLIIHTKQVLEKSKTDDYGMLSLLSARQCLNVRVSKSALHRALCIMDALLKALEVRGYFVEVSKHGHVSTHILMGAEKVRVRLSEKSIRSEREKTTVKKDPSLYSTSNKWIYNPSGKLTFEIDEYIEGLQKKWTDRARNPLQEQINEILTGLILVGEALRLRSIEREVEQSRQHEQELRWLEEQERRSNLDKQCEAWSQSQQLREFLRACEKSFIERSGEIALNSPEAKWLSWAHRYADQIDPLKNGRLEDSIFNLIPKDESS